MAVKKEEKSKWWIFVPLLLALVLCTPGFDEIKKIQHLVERGEISQGEVVGIDKLRNKSLGQPIVIYTSGDGEPVKKVFDDPLGGVYKVGDIVTVIFDPEKPLQAKIKTHYGMYSLVYLPFALAGASGLLSMWFLFERLRAVRAIDRSNR